MLSLAAGCGRDRDDDVVTTTAGDLTLEVVLRTNPPRQEDNVVEVVVMDREGRPVDGADVVIEASMPSMAWVPGMRSLAGVEPQGQGRYRGELDVAMGGTWALDIDVESAAGSGRASYAFTLGVEGLEARVGSAPATSPVTLPEAVVEPLRSALGAYEDARSLLAADRLDGLGDPATRLARALRAASAALREPATDVGNCLDHAAAPAERMASATELAAAREAFGETSRFLIALVALDARLAADLHLFECPMTATFNLWMQPSPEVENPYLGRAMPTCGAERAWELAALVDEPRGGGRGRGTHDGADGDGSEHGAGDGDEVAYYSCSMHTHVRSEERGTCPICSMDLVPVTQREVETGEIVVDGARRQTIGVRTGRVERRPLRVTVRASGKVAFDETRLAEVSVKVPGWIGRLHVGTTGQRVRRGETLFTLYSPELYAAQGEYLAALESQRRARATSAPDRADYLVEASRRRLRLWDLRDEDLDSIAASGQPLEQVPIASPVAGHVIEKNVVAGAAVEPGMTLYRIAGLDRVWVEAEVYESELPLVEVGQRATVTLPNLPGTEIAGRVAFVFPYLDDAARTGRVRIEVPNVGLELKPAMYADVTLEVERGEAVMVPESAVLYAGERRLVFRDLGLGRLEPRAIEVGIESGDWIEVRSGLEEGDLVVTSGTFLVAAESRLKSGTEQWQ
jgi:Cu(I)/Ag(I) efflux system membrane fusion protein